MKKENPFASLLLRVKLPSQRVVFTFYIIAVFLLFLYSFTQIDLSLTFSRFALLRSLQHPFQYIGYFDRPLSTYLYIFILILFYFLYALILRTSHLWNRGQVWNLVLIIAGVLFLSYNAFSYDIFNYMFDAKIITFYHQNPYLHKALDFPGDPMLSFMRWTHRVYPYGPLWLAITVPLSWLGHGFLLPTFYLFKGIMALSYLGTVYLLEKILKKFTPGRELLGVLLFACNPLVIYEALVSAHNDIVMMFFALLAFYFLCRKKYFWSIVILLVSIGIKFATALLLPVFLIVILAQKMGKKIPMIYVFYVSIVLMAVATLLATFRTNFQPWYILFFLPIVALIPDKRFITLPVSLYTFIALLTYIPYLYSGNWDPPIMNYLNLLYVVGFLLCLGWVYFLYIFKSPHHT